VPAAVLAALVLASWRLVMRTFGRAGFYLLFAISVTASVQLVGVYLVFASLMVPALATRSVRKHALAAGYAVGLAGYLIGLVLSAVFDLPTGAVIVWTLTVVALASAPLLGRLRATEAQAAEADSPTRA
jgi:zinc/manganese transport system permease protein